MPAGLMDGHCDGVIHPCDTHKQEPGEVEKWQGHQDATERGVGDDEEGVAADSQAHPVLATTLIMMMWGQKYMELSSGD